MFIKMLAWLNLQDKWGTIVIMAYLSHHETYTPGFFCIQFGMLKSAGHTQNYQNGGQKKDCNIKNLPLPFGKIVFQRKNYKIENLDLINQKILYFVHSSQLDN